MPQNQIELARNHPDKKVVDNAAGECARCGGRQKVITYYDHLAPDRECANCRRTW